MHHQYSFEPADLREAQRVANRNRPTSSVGRGIVGWVVFLVLALLFIYLLQARRPATVPPGAPPAAGSMSTWLVPFVPWVVVLLFVCVVVFRSRHAAARNNPILQQLVGFHLDEGGVTTTTGAVRTHFGWDGLDRLIETDHQFLIRETNSRSWLSLPKRAIADPAEVLAVRDL